MIGTTLQYVAKTLDATIRQRLRLMPTDQKVIFTPLVDLDGSVAVPEEQVLTLSLASMQKDPVASGSAHPNPPGPEYAGQGPPPIHLNLYVILGAYFPAREVQSGLDVLTMAISYLQAKPSWNSQNSPGLPSSVQRLVFEMESLDLHQQSHLWGSIGAKYLPSVLYKIRMIILDSGLDQVVPAITQTDVSAS